ncbi:hypothetical protein Z959_13055 [Clostridium novyi B str. ATCC 27606]|uniref:Lipoprotein n=1 Tax=Clostridium novyi B str. ATCC 27606 TaxID=1443123 RepID=A0AA40IRS2_CLONO|nr:hypothetical protein [Clostridium novyi]KEI08524.1 hypothetical protein Z958_12645 [Clostridium novyi B str. NCTC 9691]KEI11795.1 hypothetical protein Z959_13055 [Clostridium novyi B str. ATCC 27606]
MKKISVIVVAIFSCFLVGCSSSDKKASLNSTDVNQKVVNNKDLSEKSVNDEKLEEKVVDEKDKKEVVENSNNVVKVNIKTKNSNKGSTSLNNKKTRNSKIQKNNVKGFIINEMDLEKNSPFKMDMSIDTVRSILKKNNIKIDNETEVTSRLNDPEFGDKILDIKNMNLQFDKRNNKLCSIGVVNNYKTSLGLAIGDSIIKMKKLYGTKYTMENLDNIITYIYKINNHYFSVHEQNNGGKVSGWSIKKA